MMKINYKIWTLKMLFLAAASFSASCSNDYFSDPSGVEVGAEVPVTVRILSRGSTYAVSVGGRTTYSDFPDDDPNVLPHEEDIRSIRLIVFGAQGSRDAGRMVCNQRFSKINPVTQAITAGLRDVHIIVNDTLILSTALDAVTTVEQLDAIKITLNQAQAPDSSIVMHHVLKGFTIKAPTGGSAIGQTVDATVKRTNVKMSFAVSFDPSGFMPDNPLYGRTATFEGFKVFRVPKFSYMTTAQRYDKEMNTDNFMDGGYVAEDQNSDRTMTVGEPKIFRFYTNEYYRTSNKIAAQYASYICLYVFYSSKNGDLGLWRRYRIYLGDNPEGSDYNLYRNHHYKITATIKSSGDAETEIDIMYMLADAWEDQGEIDNQVRHFPWLNGDDIDHDMGANNNENPWFNGEDHNEEGGSGGVGDNPWDPETGFEGSGSSSESSKGEDWGDGGDQDTGEGKDPTTPVPDWGEGENNNEEVGGESDSSTNPSWDNGGSTGTVNPDDGIEVE